MKKVLVINTGSTSTKLALYEDETCLFSENLFVPPDQKTGIGSLEARIETVNAILKAQKVAVQEIDIIAARGGTLPQIEGGAYWVSRYMADVARRAPLSAHESSLACMIALDLKDRYGIKAIIYDAVSTNEAQELAKYTGVPGVYNSMRGHPLNSRKVAYVAAKKMGISYEQGAFIVAHLGGSISVSAHRDGRIIDMSDAFTGAMSPQRAGRLPTDVLLQMCFSGEYTHMELYRKLNGGAGLMGYFETQDARDVQALADSGDEKAKLILEVMAYQVAKAVAEMRVALGRSPDRILFTGGLANSASFVARISDRVSFLGDVEVIPGEMEMEALAEGALRVLAGTEKPKTYQSVPAGYTSQKDFYHRIEKREI